MILGCPIAVTQEELEKVIETKLTSLCSLIDVLASDGFTAQFEPLSLGEYSEGNNRI